MGVNRADAGREPGPEDLRRAVRLCRATGWASAATCAALAFAITGLRRRVPLGAARRGLPGRELGQHRRFPVKRARR